MLAGLLAVYLIWRAESDQFAWACAGKNVLQGACDTLTIAGTPPHHEDLMGQYVRQPSKTTMNRSGWFSATANRWLFCLGDGEWVSGWMIGPEFAVNRADAFVPDLAHTPDQITRQWQV